MEADKATKTLILMRGLPGSGKSTKAKMLAAEQGVVFSTDDFFMVGDKYVFDPKMIGEYHDRNYERTVQAIKQQKPLIVIDNTNIKLWQMRKYVEAAQQNGYQVRIEQPDTDWAFNYKKCALKNSHGVPEQSIKNMCNNYEVCKGVQEIKKAKDTRRPNNRK